MDARMKCRILVIGDVMLDCYVRGEVKRISPEAPVPVLLKHTESFHLGGAANLAANVRGLGGDVDLVGFVGFDRIELMLTLMREHDISWKGTVVPQPTTTKTRYCSSTHSGHHLLRVDTDCHAKSFRLLEGVHLDEYDSIIICDYLKGVVSNDMVACIARSEHDMVFYDQKPASPAPCPEWCVKMNRSEADAAFVGLDLNRAIPDFAREFVMTLGAGGAMVIQRHVIQSHPALCKSPVDVSGAGDTFMAAYAVARTRALGIPESLEFASKAAAVAVSQPGTAIVKLEDIK